MNSQKHLEWTPNNIWNKLPTTFGMNSQQHLEWTPNNIWNELPTTFGMNSQQHLEWTPNNIWNELPTTFGMNSQQHLEWTPNNIWNELPTTFGMNSQQHLEWTPNNIKTIWESLLSELPTTLKPSESLSSFRKNLKTSFQKIAFPPKPSAVPLPGDALRLSLSLIMVYDSVLVCIWARASGDICAIEVVTIIVFVDTRRTIPRRNSSMKMMKRWVDVRYTVDTSPLTCSHTACPVLIQLKRFFSVPA